MAEATGSHPPKEFFQKQLSSAYIQYEESLLLSHSSRPGVVDHLRESYEQTLSKVTERNIFKSIPDEDQRKSMRETALNAAKDFWTKKLEEPGLPTNATTLGRERITEITQKLEELNKPLQNPQ